MAQTFYDFEAALITGQNLSMADLRGDVVLVVNTASKCGFTPQYQGLEELHKTYEGKGLRILGFPCNQFGKQEPGTTHEIGEFCSLNYGVTFTLCDKIDVNGTNAAPLFTFLKEQQPGILGSTAIKWNFTKFLIGRDGKVLARYAPATKPSALQQDIEQALAKSLA